MQRNNIQEILATSGTIVINDATGLVYVNPPTLAASLGLKMPAHPQDQDLISFQFGGTITGANTVVTALTILANTGQTLLGAAITTAKAGTNTEYQYRKSNTTWYKIQ